MSYACVLPGIRAGIATRSAAAGICSAATRATAARFAFSDSAATTGATAAGCGAYHPVLVLIARFDIRALRPWWAAKSGQAIGIVRGRGTSECAVWRRLALQTIVAVVVYVGDAAVLAFPLLGASNSKN